MLLHAGYMNGEAKTLKLHELGLWAADDWDATMAPVVLKRQLSRQPDGVLWKVAVMLSGFGGLAAWAWRRGLAGLASLPRPPFRAASEGRRLGRL